MVRARGYPGGPSHFRDIIASIRPRPKAEAFLRLRTLPGEQGQVDWGSFGKIRIGRALRLLLAFVLVLSWSRRIYLRFFIGSRMPCFLAGHARAFERLGGVPRVLLYDNLKSAVVERRGDAIRLNPTMLGLAAHYGFEPRACAPRRGNEKGRVERAIRYIRSSFFAAREYASLDDLNAQAEAWCEGLAMDRRWPDDHSRKVRDAFEEERPRLLPLPEQPFPCEERVPVRVGKTPYVRFDLNDYSVPPTQVRTELEVLASTERVRIVRGPDVLAEHSRSYDRGLRIEDPTHLEALVEERTAARQHRATERLTTLVPSSEAFLVRCAERGQNIGSMTAQLMRLCVDYGSCPLEQALVEALAKDLVGVSSIRHLVRQHAQAHTPPPPPVPLDGHPRLAALTVILIVRCAFKACRAVWRLLPIFLARFLRRRWRTIADLLRGSRPAARRTLERWLARLRSSGAAIVAALGGSGLPSLRALAARLGRGATRLEVLDTVGGLDALGGLAALLHELAPQVRLL